MKENIVKLNEHISLLNIELKLEETHKLLNLLMPLKEVLYNDPANSLFIYFSGTSFHAESFIKVNGQFGSTHVQAFNIEDLVKKLIPEVFISIKKSNLFPKTKQLDL